MRTQSGRSVRRGVVCAALALVTIALMAPSATAAAGDATARPVRRVLIVSLPGVAWPDLVGAHVPHLRRLFAQSALGALAMGGLAEGMGLVLPVLIGGCLALAVGVTGWIFRGRFEGQVEARNAQ